MLSKRAKARGAKGKSSRTARPNQKSKASSRQPLNRRGQQTVGSISAPLATSVVLKRMYGMRFDRAPPHDEFPEGGLRISGIIPGGTLVQDTVLFGAQNTAGLATAAINPTGASVAATTTPLFSSTTSLAVFAQYFRRFRFRKLDVIYVSEVQPGVSTAAAGAGLQVQLAHEPDIVTAEQASGSYTMDTAVVSRNCTRFAAWTPEISCPIIAESKSSSADELFFTSTAGDSQSASGDAALRQCHQGGFTATVSAVNGTADLTIATVLLSFTVDLYGYTNIVVGLLPASRERAERKRRAEQSLIQSAPSRAGPGLSAKVDADDPDVELLPPTSVRSNAGWFGVQPAPLERKSNAPPSKAASLK